MFKTTTIASLMLIVAGGLGASIPEHSRHNGVVEPKVKNEPVVVESDQLAEFEHTLAIRRENILAVLACLPHVLALAISIGSSKKDRSHKCGACAYMIAAGFCLLVIGISVPGNMLWTFWLARCGLWISGVGHGVVLVNEALAEFRGQLSHES